MPIELVQASAADAVAATKMAMTSFTLSSKMSQAMHPKGPTDASVQHSAKREIERLSKPNAKEFNFLMKDTETGAIVGMCNWALKDEETYDEEIKALTSNEPPKSEPDPDSNQAAVSTFFGLIGYLRRHIMGRRKYWYLALLVTSHEHERRGAGSLGMKWGLERAAADGLDVYISATATGKNLYEKHGFTVQRVAPLDLLPFGMDYINKEYGMLRKAAPRT